MTTGKHVLGKEPNDEPVKAPPPVLSRRFRIAVVVGVATTVLLSLLTSAAILSERSSRRAAIQEQIRNLACAIVAPFPDSTDFIADLRVEYQCPPYDPRLSTRIIPARPVGTPSTIHAPAKRSSVAPAKRPGVAASKSGSPGKPNGPAPASTPAARHP